MLCLTIKSLSLFVTLVCTRADYRIIWFPPGCTNIPFLFKILHFVVAMCGTIAQINNILHVEYGVSGRNDKI